MTRVLCINPGSTSTKAALFEGENQVFVRGVSHRKEEVAAFPDAISQLDFRLSALQGLLADLQEGDVDAVVGRGGLLRPVPGGAFAVNQTMLEELRAASHGDHPCNLGAFLAEEFANRLAADSAEPLPRLVVDPVVTDEMLPVVRLTGLKGLSRRSVFHALSQRGAAREAARRLGLEYEHAAFIVAHLGGGISIGAHCWGRVVDVINALDGEGPMSAERTGLLPVVPLLERIAAGDADPLELKRTVLRQGGLFSHLGTNDLRKALELAREDESVMLVVEALAYSIARSITSLAPALRLEGAGHAEGAGLADAVVLTGGMARSNWLMGRLSSLVGWLAPIVVIPDEAEMRAMAQGAINALSGRSEIREYGEQQ